MKQLIAAATLVALATTSHVRASGPLGIYGVIEKVVIESSGTSSERIQVWGAFAYAEGGSSRGLDVSPVKTGYLYFQIPEGAAAAQVETIRREWADLKAVAGTGQAVGFGNWHYLPGFGTLVPDAKSSYVVLSRGGPAQDVRARPSSESPTAPAIYDTNAGIVKLADNGTHAAIVKQLKDALRR